MPFVRRQRKYYKDGVEVPVESITDFGSTKYFKNVVTTKYWKEITTGSKELEYACYVNSSSLGDFYMYVKVPFGGDKAIYGNKYNYTGQVSSPDDLSKATTYSSVSEETVVYNGSNKATRYRDGDLYKDTTVTETVEGTPEDYTYTTEEVVPVEVTADDEYDYTEFVPSTQFDYYEDSNKLYQLATVKRSYWKYQYQNWTQPKATANTTAVEGGNMVITASSTYGYWKAYGVLDGLTSGETNGWVPSNTTSAWWQVKFPYKLKITGLKHYNAQAESSIAITSGRFYTDSTMTTPIGNAFSTPNTDWYTTTISGIPAEGIITDTIYFNRTGAGFSGIGELVITAQKEVVVETTKEQADYYTDKLLSYAPIVRGGRTYYKQDLKQRDTGTYTFTLNKDYTAKMLFVGNGGGGCSSQKDSRWHVSSGGSGACFEGIVRLPADTYTLTIGSLGYGNNANNTHYHSSSIVSTDSYLTNSAGQELIRVGAGGNGYTSVGGVGGAAGVLTLGTLDILETKKATDGVYTAGNVSTGSLSAYDNTYTGYGAGTSGTHGQGNVYGIAGIFDLVLETDINDFDWYEDVATKIY